MKSVFLSLLTHSNAFIASVIATVDDENAGSEYVTIFHSR